MIEETFDQQFPNAPISKIYYSQPMIMIEDDSQLLLAFLKQLTFQSSRLLSPSLTPEEVEKLKTIFDKLHSHAKRHKLTLKEIQGIWPLLSIMFMPINGLQLYLEFQKLLMPIAITEVKQEQGQFSPNGYFQQNNDWKDDKKIMSALRILERTLVKGSYEKNKQEIHRFYELIAVDKAQYLIITKDFENRFEQFRRIVIVARKLQFSSKLTDLLSDSFFGIKRPTSEPDLLTNTLKMFSLSEIEDIHDTKTNKIVPIIEQDIQDDIHEVSPAKQSQTMSPPKHKHRIGCSDTTKHPKQHHCKNNTRFFYAKKFFELQKKQNIVLSEMKTKKALINRQRHRRSKLQKLTSKSRKANYYHSDEEEKNRRMRKKNISQGKFKEKDEYIYDYQSEVYSDSEQMLDRCDEEELSEEPVMKRNSKFHKKTLTIDPYFELDVEEDYQISTKRFSFNQGIHQFPSAENRQKQNIEKYMRNSIRINQAEESIKTSQKIVNLEIRQLITVGGDNFSSDFDFWRYRRYLETLEGKEIIKEANKITIELINRDSIAFDKSILLKTLTFFTLSIEKERNQSEWKLTRDKYIRIALKFTIRSNIYRGICEIINCFFDRNEDEATLIQAKEYFKILAEYGQAFKHISLQQQISQMIFDALLTPRKYRQFKNSHRFSSQVEQTEFTSPFSIARKALKYHLIEHQELIAFLIGQFTLISLTLEKFFYDCSVSLQKQRQYFSQLNTQLSQMKNDHSCSLPYSFITATIQMKNFYLMYRPRLNDNYLKGLVNFFHLSFSQLLIKSIKEEAEEEAKEHIEFVAAVFQDFIQKEFSKSPPAMGANVYSRLMKTQTKLKQSYQNIKEANVALLFSTIFSLFLKWPQFRAANLGKQLIGTFRSTVLLGLESNLYKLKPALYSPILNCIFDLYSYKVELFLRVDHLQATEKEEYQPIRRIINSAWDKLSQNYRSCLQEIEVTMQQKNNRNEGRSRAELIIPKLRRCQTGFTLFLNLFMLDGTIDRPNFLRQSYSHRFYCLQFILRQQHFIKFFQNATTYPEYASKQFIACIIEVMQRWFFFLPTIDFFFEKYSDMIMDLRRYYGSYEQKRAMQFSLLSEVKDSGIQQSLVNIYATQLIVTIIDHSEKGKQINFLENPVFKVLDQNTDPTLTSFAKISKSIHLFDHFLNRIIRFFEVEQFNLDFLGEKAKTKIKKAFYDFMKEKFIKKITLLIMLAALVKNSYEYESIPLKQIVQNLKKLRLFDQKNPIEQKIPFQCQLFFQEGLQKIQSFTGIQQILTQIIKWRNQSAIQSRNKRALEGFKALFQDLYNCVKKLSSQRQKEAITLEWMKWAAFAMQWPEILNHEKLLKDRAHLSEFKINTSSIKVFLTLLQVVDGRRENIYRIKEIAQIFVENLCRNLLQREEELCKQVRRTLMCVRQCLQEEETLAKVGKQLVEKIILSFCDPERLSNLSSGLARLRLQIYFEMMEGSDRERQGYQALLMHKDHAKKFTRLIPRFMKGNRNLKRQPCQTIENLILSCMIGKHSCLRDVKCLLTTLKNSNSALCSSKKALYSKLFYRLRAQAQENQNWELASQCKDQIAQIQSDTLDDWMDIE